MASEIPITVVITSYKRADLTIRAIESVLACEPSPAEILIVDDGSPDDSAEVLSTWSANFEQVRVIGLSENVGVSAARNIGIRAAKCEYVTNLDGDDTIAGTRKLGEEYACCCKGVGVIASSVCVRNYESSGRIERVDPPHESMTATEALPIILERKWVPRDPMYSKSLFEKSGGFDEAKSLYEDWDFKIRLISLCNQVVFSGVDGTEYRIGEGGLSDRSKLELCHAENAIRWKNRRIFRQHRVAIFPYFKEECRLRFLNIRSRISSRLRRIRNGS